MGLVTGSLVALGLAQAASKQEQVGGRQKTSGETEAHAQRRPVMSSRVLSRWDEEAQCPCNISL